VQVQSDQAKRIERTSNGPAADRMGSWSDSSAAVDEDFEFSRFAIEMAALGS
jgi:hypothetical protein